ncbi:beta-ketoacyl-[acyl-carrier-protein] synthase II, partial [Acinetobacter baumannii]
MAVGIQFSVGLSALGCEPDQIKQALQKPQQTLTLRDDLIVDRNVWVGQYTHLLCSSVPDALQSVDSRNLRFALTALAKI